MQKKTKCWIRLSLYTGMLDQLEKIIKILQNNFQIDHIKISNYDSFWAKKIHYLSFNGNYWIIKKLKQKILQIKRKPIHIKLFITTLYLNTVIAKKLLIVLQKNSRCKLSKLAKKGFTLTGRKTWVWKLISIYFISSLVLQKMTKIITN